MLSLAAAIGYGAAGGSAAEAVVVWGRLHAWQLARHAALADGMALPPFTRFIDLGPDLAVAFTRVLLGCMANGLALSRFSVIYATPPCVITPRSPVQGSRAVQEHLCLTRPYVSKARTLGGRPGSGCGWNSSTSPAAGPG
jgi:hypothetical protein